MLSKYDAAKAALNAARSFEDVLAIKDKAQAYEAVARVAKDAETVLWATEIKTRAERIAGEMLLSLDLKPGRPEKNGNSELPLSKARLAELKVEKIDSSRWQQLAKVPEEKFEEQIAAGHVSRSAIVKATSEPKPPAPPKPPVVVEEVSKACPNCRKLESRLSELDSALRSYSEVCESDDKVSSALKEIRRLTELNRILEERNNGLLGEKNAAIKQAKYWEKKAVAK